MMASGGGVVNLTNKPKSEITITPVVNSMAHSLQQSFMQQQLDHHQHQQQQRLQQHRQEASSINRPKQESFMMVG